MSDAKKMVKVTIDGREVSVEEGLPLIDAATKLGIDIPRFCYHPHLSIAGNCRMCAVEVEKARGLPISCATPCAEGMVAKTDTEAVKKHRAAVMEFLLVNHPIDCPICDQAGECWLQIYYMQHDLKPSRLDVDKVHYLKRVPVGPRVTLDQERCVECTRCIRFCDEVTKTGELRMVNRGDRNVIATFPGIPLDNHYSVNTADICPVGALTQTDFRFKARVWFLRETPSLCPGCARGCNVAVDYWWHDIVKDHNGKAYRLRPRVNDAVNRAWMCDLGRPEYHRVNEARLAGGEWPGGSGKPAGAVREAAAALAQVGPRELLIVGSLEDTLEEMALLRKLGTEAFDGAQVACVPDRADGVQDDLLLRADKHPNRQGAAWLGLLAEPRDLAKLLAGKKAVIVHRADLLAFDEGGRIRAAFEAVPLRIAVAANATPTTALATHRIAATSFIEKDGHWVNFEGRVQRLFKGSALKLPPAVLDDLAILSGLAGGAVEADPRSLFAELAAQVPQMAGMSWDAVGLLGQPGAGQPGVPV